MIEHSTDFVIRELTTNQHEEVVALLASVDGIVVRGADQENGLKRYLERNPGTSFSAVLQGRTVGCILSGHDGRRGYIYHLAVAPD
jgi:ribosomal protein S18 acetylase RimI-like enzyme